MLSVIIVVMLMIELCGSCVVVVGKNMLLGIVVSVVLDVIIVVIIVVR